MPMQNREHKYTIWKQSFYKSSGIGWNRNLYTSQDVNAHKCLFEAQNFSTYHIVITSELSKRLKLMQSNHKYFEAFIVFAADGWHVASKRFVTSNKVFAHLCLKWHMDSQIFLNTDRLVQSIKDVHCRWNWCFSKLHICRTYVTELISINLTNKQIDQIV